MDNYVQIREFLEELDSDEGFYEPSSLTYEEYLSMIEEIEVIKREIESLIGEELKINKNTQDASFIAEIRVEEFMKTKDFPKGRSLPKLAIIFSNFGRLVSIGGSDPATLERYPLDQIINLLLEHGFIHIPDHYLEQKYTGRHPLGGEQTWYERFFSYL